MADDALTPLPIRNNDAGEVIVSIDQTTEDANKVVAAQGMAAETAAAWPIKVTDGTDTITLEDGDPSADAMAVPVRNIPGDSVQKVQVVDFDPVISPKLTYVATANIAVSGSETANSAEITTGKIAELSQVVCSASIPCKFEIQKVVNNVATTLAVLFTSAANLQAVWTPPSKSYATILGVDGETDNWRVVCYNMDNKLAKGAYVTFLWDEETV